jgi:hypothetical protein
MLREEYNAPSRSTGAEEPGGPAALHRGFKFWRAPEERSRIFYGEEEEEFNENCFEI